MFRILSGWICVGMFAIAAPLALQSESHAQTGLTVQLPTRSIFSVRTVVKVPDGGTTRLGGVKRAAYSSNSRGVPGLSNLPFAGRPFRNKGIGSEVSASHADANVRIISLKEMEEDLLRNQSGMMSISGRRQEGQNFGANGVRDVQRKADFLSRHIGRKQR